MQLGTEDKKVSMHRLVIVFLIAFIVLVIALVILYLNEQQKITEEMNQIQKPQKEPQQEPNQTAVAGGAVPPGLTQAEINQIKMDIVTGKRLDVPAAIAPAGETRQFIISEYLYNCYSLENINKRVECYDIYFINNDASYRQQKQSCERLSSAELTKCMDKLYFDTSVYKPANICQAIKNNTLREECLVAYN